MARFRSAFAELLLAALALRALPADAQSAPALPQPIYTRQSQFSIPYRIGAVRNEVDRPVEVLLGLSTDEGRTWRVSSRAQPGDGQFVFHAPHDGEYWFYIRTRDRQGKYHPEVAPQPELRVIVDTVVPRLEITARRGPGGEVIVAWQAVDPNLQPESLTLDYQAGPYATWQPLAIERPRDAQRHAAVGESSWWPKEHAGQLAVRAQVVDRAGNPAVSQVQVTDAAPPAGATTRQSPAAPPSAAPHWPPYAPPNAPAAPGPRAGFTPPDAAASGQSEGPYAAGPPGAPPGVAWPADNYAPGTRSAPPASEQQPWHNASTVSPNGSGGTARVLQPAPPTVLDGGTAGAPLDLSALPPGERPRMVNSRSFELEYEIESIGPSGVSKVELWGTTDGGRSWISYGADADNRSPLAVRVEQDGVYGFRIVVASGRGTGGEAPRSGDVADLWIGVDRNRPAARITSCQLGRDGNELTINWEAHDERLEARPISLWFSDQPIGPWTALAAGLENTGNYLWRLDARVPERIYLKLEARDEAGNVTGYQTADPVLLDRAQPQGRIRAVRPVEQGALPARSTRR